MVGKRDPFSPADVKRIKARLAKRGDAGLRDLALFSTAIDTMLRTPDLLGLTVKDVRKRNRVMRDTLELAPVSGGRRSLHVRCTLSKTTIRVLERWINKSAKKPDDYLFTGRLSGGLTAITPRQFSRLVKAWAEGIGLDVSTYGIESLRRTRAIHILNRSSSMEAVRVLLGFTDIGKTARYLGDSKPVDALMISRKYEL